MSNLVSSASIETMLLAEPLKFESLKFLWPTQACMEWMMQDFSVRDQEAAHLHLPERSEMTAVVLSSNHTSLVL
jgi:hypothetical protein